MFTGDEELERVTMREELAQNLWGIPFMPNTLAKMPFNSNNDDPQYLDISRWVPGGDIFDQREEGIPLVPPPLQPSGLYVDLYNTIALRKDPYTGLEIEGLGVDQNTQAIAKAIIKRLTPNVGVIPGSYAWDKWQKAIRVNRGEEVLGSKYAAPYSFWEALAYGLGIKLKPQDPTANQRVKRFEYNKLLTNIDREIYDAQEDQQRGNISKSKRDKIVERNEEKRIQIAAEYASYLRLVREAEDKMVRRIQESPRGPRRGTIFPWRREQKVTGGLVEGSVDVPYTKEDPATRINSMTGEPYTKGTLLETLKLRRGGLIKKPNLLGTLQKRQQYSVGKAVTMLPRLLTQIGTRLKINLNETIPSHLSFTKAGEHIPENDIPRYWYHNLRGNKLEKGGIKAYNPTGTEIEGKAQLFDGVYLSRTPFAGGVEDNVVIDMSKVQGDRSPKDFISKALDSFKQQPNTLIPNTGQGEAHGFYKGAIPKSAIIKGKDLIDVDTFARDESGFVSPTIQALIESAPSHYKGKQILTWARGKRAATKKGVKPNELEFLGLEEFISANPDATLRETIEGISGNKVRISKHIISGESGDYLGYEQTTAKIDPLDGSNLWEPQATDIRYSLKQGDVAIKKDLVNFYNLKARLAARSSEGPGVAWAHASGSRHTVDYVDKIPKSIIDDVVEDFAESQYMNNPYTIIKPRGGALSPMESQQFTDDTFAMGNDDVGYQIFVNGKRVTDPDDIAYSATEAELNLRDAIRAEDIQGVDSISDSRMVAEHKLAIDNSLPGGSNFRAVVFNWDNAPKTHNVKVMGEGHFEDDTQFAHALIRDRKLSDGTKKGEGAISLHGDELQSDLHTAGSRDGYELLPRQRAEVFRKLEDFLKDYEDFKLEYFVGDPLMAESYSEGVKILHKDFEKPISLYDIYHTGGADSIKESFFVGSKQHGIGQDPSSGIKTGNDQYKKFMDIIEPIVLEGPWPNYPYKKDYHKRVIKELLLLAIEEGKTALSFSSSQAIKSRYAERYATFFEMLYDGKIPSFMKKLADKYGGKFERGGLDLNDTFGDPKKFTRYSPETFPALERANAEANILRITPEMKEKILKEGLQSFAVGGIVASQHDAGRGLLARENYAL